MMDIVISCDHAGFDLKEKVKQVLIARGTIVNDMGPATADRVDYPDMIHPLAKAIDEGREAMGIIICGSGNGVAMTANKYANVRAALCWNREIAALARQHNDANVLALPARFISEEEALACVEEFVTEKFEGGRHAERVEKIAIK
ncbi:MAG: ribose 5-phosphate isomerase B [Flavobacteriales bacterium]|nr:ribose 5-phosphate isomerase B [Flavobacteriales bacterium]